MDKQDLKLLFKLGIIDTDTPMGDAFLRWGKLIGDPLVFERSLTIPSKKYPNLPAATGDIPDVIDSFSKEERRALRDRVLGVAPFPESLAAK